MIDYYKVLGVNKNCNQNDIKRAYRKLAMKYHPDKSNSDTSDIFRKITDAYEVLGDETKRRQYDNRSVNPIGNMNIFSTNPFDMFRNMYETNINTQFSRQIIIQNGKKIVITETLGPNGRERKVEYFNL